MCLGVCGHVLGSCRCEDSGLNVEFVQNLLLTNHEPYSPGFATNAAPIYCCRIRGQVATPFVVLVWLVLRQ